MITICAYCGVELDTHNPLGEHAVPENRDFGFCVHCGEFNMFMNGKMIEVEYDDLDIEILETMQKITKSWEDAGGAR